jgi:hypothetical protein
MSVAVGSRWCTRAYRGEDAAADVTSALFPTPERRGAAAGGAAGCRARVHPWPAVRSTFTGRRFLAWWRIGVASDPRPKSEGGGPLPTFLSGLPLHPLVVHAVDGRVRAGIVVLAALTVAFAVVSAVQVVRSGTAAPARPGVPCSTRPQPRPDGRPAG